MRGETAVRAGRTGSAKALRKGVRPGHGRKQPGGQRPDLGE